MRLRLEIYAGMEEHTRECSQNPRPSGGNRYAGMGMDLARYAGIPAYNTREMETMMGAGTDLASGSGSDNYDGTIVSF